MIRLIRYGIRQPQLSFQPILNLKRYRGVPEALPLSFACSGWVPDSVAV